MAKNPIDNKKIDIPNRQDAIDAEIVDKYLINNSHSKNINLACYIDQKASLKKISNLVTEKQCKQKLNLKKISNTTKYGCFSTYCAKNAAFSYSKQTTRNRNEGNPGYHAKYNSRDVQDI